MIVGGTMNDPKVIEAESRIRDAGRRAGKSMWVIGDAEELQKRGHRFLCIGEPTMALKAALSGSVDRCRARV